MKMMCAAKFKEQCPAVLDHLDAEGLVIMKRGKPIARVVPCDREFTGLIGSLIDKIEIRGDVTSTGVRWNADAEP